MWHLIIGYIEQRSTTNLLISYYETNLLAFINMLASTILYIFAYFMSKYSKWFLKYYGMNNLVPSLTKWTFW